MTLVMGILNVTPDSFSDGGRFTDSLTPQEAECGRGAGFTRTAQGQPVPAVNVVAAVEAAVAMLAQGADLIDVGGESTRPGAPAVDPVEEQRRVMPVLEELILRRGVPVSLDTRHAQVARAALELAGARAPELIINDVSGLLTDTQMPAVVAEFGCDVIITHNRGDSETMQQKTQYDDVVGEVIEELLQIRQWYLDAGVEPHRIILDPGIGFAKTHAQNWELIRQLSRLTGLGHRVLFGASRKGFLGALLADEHSAPRPAAQRDDATVALTTIAAGHRAWAVRVHAVGPNADALRALTAAEAVEDGDSA